MRSIDRGRGTHPLVWVPAVAVAAIMVLPVVYLFLTVGELGPASTILAEVASPRTLRLLGRTLTLAAAVTAASVVLAVPLAWLTVRTDLPARRWFAVGVTLPLVVPTYVGAFALIAALAPGGLVPTWTGLPAVSPYGFRGAFVVLTLLSAPYVLITVQASLVRLDPALEEASRLLGRSRWRTFVAVVLPQLRPATAAGALLVALYVVSDFGAVSMLRYPTLTRAIHLQYRAAFDRAPAALLGLLLVAVTVVLLVGEARAGRARGAGTAVGGQARRPSVVPLGRWRWPAVALCSAVIVAGLGIPVVVVSSWTLRAVAAGEPVAAALAAARRSVVAAGLGALTAVLAALPVALWSSRSRARAARLVERASFAGYALPGIVVALALVFIGIRTLPALYQTLTMLVAAYVILFLPQVIGAVRATLLQVDADSESAARLLGASRMAALRRVTLPLARRGAIGGGLLVFLTALKELPATLLLAPTGYETLATRVWSATSEAFFARAALPALLLIAIGAVPLALSVGGRTSVVRATGGTEAVRGDARSG
jgi:iron(III) transport system permease protein